MGDRKFSMETVKLVASESSTLWKGKWEKSYTMLIKGLRDKDLPGESNL